MPREKAPSFSKYRPTSTASSAVAAANRATNTKPELALRRALWRRGLRYRLRTPKLPGRPDLIFPNARLAVFCDGDFWHGRDWPSRRRKLAEGSNPKYWVSKIAANRARDNRINRELRLLGWHPFRVWESEIYEDLPEVVVRIELLFRERKRIHEKA